MIDINVLNPPQKKAVTTTTGPLLVLAGAGSGKTRAVTYRIAALLEGGVSPYEILALTFTNKAAKEMKERVVDLAGLDGERVWMSTFHSFCARLLRMDIERMGYTRDFVIYDDADQMAVISEVQQKMNLREEEWPKKLLRAVFSDAKNKSLAPADYILQNGDSFRAPKLSEAMALYSKILAANNALDFDDLLLKTLELFRTFPEVLEKYASRFRYIHVDEYQDTNLAQYTLVKLLSSAHNNICVVGDDDQSIYGWRGADIRNILDFERDFPGCTVIRLEQNYRSTSNILDAANAVIAQNQGRKQKKLWTDRGQGAPLSRYTAWSERDEADFVCRTIQQGVQSGRPRGDFAVLYRVNAQSRVLEEALTGYGIPYSVIGSLKFYDRAEIKDILAYLRLLVNPRDDVSFKRAIGVPRRGVGDAAIAELSAAAEEAGLPLMTACIRADSLPISQRVKAKLRPFGDLITDLCTQVLLLPLSEAVEELLEKSGYRQYLRDEKRSDGRNEEREENVRELVNAIAEFEKNNPDDTLSAFLENVALVANISDETARDAVTLLTMHSAKGLEFPVVFIVGMEEGIFPTSRAQYDADGLEEERRLCYVALTRAREKLWLSRAESRVMYRDVQHNKPSRFLAEIPDGLFDAPDAQRRETPRPWASGSGGERSVPSNAPLKPARDLSRRNIPVGGEVYKAPPREKKNYAFAVGMKVVHDTFGRGIIKDISGSVLTVGFEQSGIKKLVAGYAPIRPE